jgi:hypothetical protein
MAGTQSISIFARLTSLPDDECVWKLDPIYPVRLVSEDKKCFDFKKILFATDNNSVVYDVVGKPSVKSLLCGFNAGIVCYGLAESGKLCVFLIS